MNVLQIGLAELIAKRDPNRFNDQQIHQIKYGKRIFTRSFIIVKTPREEGFQEFDLSENVKVFPTLSKNKYWFFWDAFLIARRIIRNNHIHLLAIQDPFITGIIGYLLKRAFRIPLCVNNVCDFIDNHFWMRESTMNRILNPIGKFILRKAGSIRVDNDHEYRKMVGLGIKREKVWNIPFILNDADQFINSKPDLKLREEILKGIFDHMILFVGRFEKQKDLPTLFQTIKRVVEIKPRTLFLIVGDGKENSAARELVKTVGIQEHVFFTGWVDYFDLPKYYAVCDAFILTSVYETSPRVIIFACLSRKPIITTDVSGVRDYVHNEENGFVVSVKNVGGLAKGILTLLENPVKMKQMGESGFKKVKDLLDEEKIIVDYRKMYEFTLSSENRKR